MKQIDHTSRLRVQFLRDNFGPVEINHEHGKSDKVDKYEAHLIRTMFAAGSPEDVLAVEFGISEELVNQVLEGYIWPYSGGKLKALALSGPNVTNGFTGNQRKFIKGVIGLANSLLNTTELDILCNFNGMSIDEARKIASHSEDLNERLTKQRYRGVLGLHSTGAEIEKCIVAFVGKTRSPLKQ